MPRQLDFPGREQYNEGYGDGYADGFVAGRKFGGRSGGGPIPVRAAKKKRKLSAWNKFVKANSKKPRFRLRSGSPNLKKLAIAFRKTPAGKKKRR